MSCFFFALFFPSLSARSPLPPVSPPCLSAGPANPTSLRLILASPPRLSRLSLLATKCMIVVDLDAEPEPHGGNRRLDTHGDEHSRCSTSALAACDWPELSLLLCPVRLILTLTWAVVYPDRVPVPLPPLLEASVCAYKDPPSTPFSFSDAGLHSSSTSCSQRMSASTTSCGNSALQTGCLMGLPNKLDRRLEGKLAATLSTRILLLNCILQPDQR